MKVTRWLGDAPISKPGIYSNIPIDTYHEQLTTAPSVSKSGLWTVFDESCEDFYSTSYLNPAPLEDPETANFILGRAAHHLFLGEADFAKHFVLRPEELNAKAWNSNRTDCKEWLAAAKAERLTVLTPGQVETIKGMSAGLARNPLVRAGILNGLIEHSMIFIDEPTGLYVKVRPDAIPTDDLDFSDLKTAFDVRDEAIEKAIGDLGYNMQGALVGMACRAILGREMTSFSLVLAKKSPPYSSRVKTLKPADLELGERQARVALDMVKRCIDRGEWPGPGGTQTDAEYVEITPWRRTRIEDRIAKMQLEMEIEI